MLRATLSRGAARALLRRSKSSAAAARPLRRAAGFLGGSVVLGAGLGGGYYAMQASAELKDDGNAEEVDALIIGGGIMGSTVAVMLKLLQPNWKVKLVEQHGRVAQESSNEWHNAGTGHAALCEPNYTPKNKKTGEVEIDKAVAVNQKFMISLAFWSWLVEMGILPDGSFIQPAPHILFVHDEDGRSWLKERVEKLKHLPAFAATEYTEDYDKIKSWVGLLCSGRDRNSTEPIACSRHPDGTEVNYGLLTRQLVQSLIELGGDVQLLSTVTALKQQADKTWLVAVQKNDLTSTNTTTVKAKFVFAASGGGSLRILQMAGIPEVAGYGGMPVSGKFLVCQKPEIIEQNRNKVYGRAAIGAPPMSVPHLDWRTIYGKDCIFFGPFAGFSPAVFKMSGSPLDWLSTFNPTNILPMIAMGVQNMDLVKYLVTEVFSSRDAQLEALRKFVPDAKPEDWTMVWAGQRIQIVKPDPQVIGKLEFGTEVLSSADGTIVGLLGASPGASVSPHIAIEVINKFNAGTNNAFNWHVALSQWIPSYGRDINTEPGLYDKVMSKARDALLEGKTSGYRTGFQHSNHLFSRIDIDADGVLSPQEISSYLSRHTSMHPTQIESLVLALDADQDGQVSREEFEKGFGKVVAGLVRRGTINRMEEVKRIAEETVFKLSRSMEKKEKTQPPINIASSKD
mmetsp:Transcript_28426/g.55396  ORF Transcript_28426/g.55396 Transcript_28426/m.55396 type:complete len:681 (+) Transcript_28426:59-2101(+)